MRRRHLALCLFGALAGCGGAATPPAARHGSPTPTPTHTPTPGHRSAAATLGPHPLRGTAARHAAVPILMYHVIASPPPGTPYPELWVPPDRFAAQMGALRRAGYRAVTLRRVLAAWRRGSPLPRRPVVVSFDDGYPSQYKAAYPVLRRLGWPGVLNLEVADVGPKGIHAAEVRALLRAGWEVDSHTLTHPDLTTLDPIRLRTELVRSRAVLRRRFGPQTAALLCYPAGRYDARVEAAVRAAGYVAATTTQPGWSAPDADRFALPRVRVDGTDSPSAVLAKISAERSA